MTKTEKEKTEENEPETEETLEEEAEEEQPEGESATEAEAKEEAVEEEKETAEESALGEEAEEGVEEEKEEEKPEEEEREEDIVEEKFYTIPLRRAWIMPPKQRAPRVMRIIRSYVEKHMKVGGTKEEAEEEAEEEKEERLIISAELNQKIWLRGIEKPPRRIKVRVTKDTDGNVTVYPAKGD